MDNKLKIEVDGTPLTLEVTTRYRKPASQVNLDKVRHRFEEYEMLVKDKEQMAMTIEALDQNVLGLEEMVNNLSELNSTFSKFNLEKSEEIMKMQEQLKKVKKSESFWFGATIVFIIVSVALALFL